MDQHTGSVSNSGEQNFFTPDEVVAPPGPTPVVTQGAVPAEAQQTDADAFMWSASEYIEHQKTPLWFMGLALIGLILAMVIWFITKDIFLAVTVLLGVIGFGVFAARRPKQTTYALDGTGLSVGKRSYPFSDFRSFSVQPEGQLLCVELAPLKRFSTYLTVYCQPKDGDRVAAILGERLPMTPPRNDLTDRFMRSIRF